MRNSAKRIVRTAGLCFLSVTGGYAQQATQQLPGPSAQIAADSLPLAPGDLVSLRLYDVPELDQAHLRVTDAGEVPLVFLGPLKVAGLTPGQAAQKIADAYTEHDLVRNGHALVTVDQYEAATVTVFGYVNGLSGGGTSPSGGAPSVSGTTGTTLPLTTPRPLLTVLSMAGGLSDRASRTVTIQRRDMNVKPFSVLVSNNASGSLENDPMIDPGDTVIVPRAGIVYILGNVGHPSGIVMAEDGRISLMQALSQAGSTLPTSRLKDLMIFRKNDGQYHSFQVNLGEMVKGKIPDIQLQPEDVVWVPFSYGKNLLVNGASIAAAVGSATASGIIYSH